MSDELEVGEAQYPLNDNSDTERCLTILAAQLKQKVAMDMWMFTTVIDNDWTILAASDNPYGVKNGDVLPWDESVCSRMVRSGGPNIVPNIKDSDDFYNAPIVSKLPICAYIGYPIIDETNEVLGTLCAINKETKDSSLEAHKDYIQDIVHIGKTLTNQNNIVKRFAKTLNMLEAQTVIDSTTGLPNQEAFFDIAAARKAEYDKIGCPLGIVVIELNGLSLRHSGEQLRYDDLVRAVSNDLSKLLRETDTIAKLDGSKFGMLFVNVENRFVSAMVIKISNALSQYKLKISIGADICREGDEILQSIENANANKLI